MNLGSITISREEYEELQEDSLFLTCLQNAGVDNWEGYEYAVEEFQEITGEGE